MAGDFESFLQDNAPAPGGAQAPASAPTLAPQSAPATDPFENFLRSQKSQQDAATVQQAQAIAVGNSSTSADAAGKAAGIARQIGAPQAAVESDLPRYEAQAKAQNNAQILAGNPKLASWVAQNPDSARVAQDDFEGLSNIDVLVGQSLINEVKPILTGLAKGAAGGFNASSLAVNRAVGGALGLVDSATGAMAQPTLSSLITGQNDGGTHLSDWWYQHMIAPSLENRTALTIPDEAPFGVKAAGAVGNMLSMLAQIGLTGGASAEAQTAEAATTTAGAVGQTVAHGARAMAFPALTSAVNTGKDVYDQTGDMSQAIRAAQMSYATTTLGGVVPLGAEGGLATRLASGFISGAASGEMSRQAMNLVMPQPQGFNPEETILSGLSGAMLSGVMGRNPLHDAVRQAYAAGTDAETAEKGGAAVQQLSELATSSKLRQHDPEAFKAYVQQAAEDGPLSHVYVDGKTLADALHQSSVESSEIPGLNDRLQEALATGGDVQIPIEDYATHIAGTDLDKAILPDLKTEEGGMTYSEGQAFFQNTADEMKARADNVVDETTNAGTTQKELSDIGDNLLEQMTATGRYPANVARASIAPVVEFYRTMAERMGTTPAEMFDRYPLRIAGGELGSESLNQSPVQVSTNDAGYTEARSDAGSVSGSVRDGALHINFADIKPEEKGKGEGKRLYRALIDDALAKGLKVYSDSTVEHEASRVYESLGRAGYDVQRLGGGTLDDGAVYGKGATEPAYQVVSGPDDKALYQTGKKRTGAETQRANLEENNPFLGFLGRNGVALEHKNDITGESGRAGNRMIPGYGPLFRKSGVPLDDLVQRAVEEHYLTPADVEAEEDTGGSRKLADMIERAYNGEAIFPLDRQHEVAERQAQEDWEAQHAEDGGAADLNLTHEDFADAGMFEHEGDAATVDALIAELRSKMGDDEAESKLEELARIHEDNGGFADALRAEIGNVEKAEGQAAGPVEGGGAEGQDTSGAAESGANRAGPNEKTQRQVGAQTDAVRGAFTPDTNTISLLKDSDLSTFLHESGHFFLSTLGDLAARPDAPQQIKDDMQTFLKWAGGKDIADWQGRTLEQQRDMHEKFARAFESYLMTGKAPTIELQSLFSRFRSWLMNVYQSLTAFHGAEPSDEVRGVFDRMLASDEAIQRAEQVRGYLPLDVKGAGATDAQAAAYARQGEQATQAAIADMQARSMKDMQWMSKAKAKVVREMQRQHDALREQVREQVAYEVMDQPENLARQFLKTGESVDPRTGERVNAEEGFKLNADAVKRMYAEATYPPDLAKLRGLTEKHGMHPDDVADLFGFRSGDDLVRSLIDGEKPEAAIERLTDQRMLERHGELTDPQAIEDAANLAVANHARARFMATGLKILSNSDIPANELAKAATEAAAQMIAAKRVRDLNPRQYEVAEAKSNRDAVAKAPKDPKGAVEAQRQALLSNRLARAAREAQTEVDKIVAEQKQYDKPSIRKKMDLDILEQIDALRERFDFRRNQPDENQKTAGQKSLSTWIRSQQDLGYSPLVNSDMTNPTVRMHYRDMTVEQIRGFRDTIQSLETIARARKSVTVEGKQRELTDVVDELIAKMKERPDQFSLEELVERPRLGVDNPMTVALDRISGFLRATAAELKPQQFKANALDAQEVLGPFSKTIFERVFRANYGKIDMLKELSDYFGKAVTEKLGADWQARMTEEVPNTRLLDADLSKDFGPKVYRRLTRGDMLGIARHVGNESNFEKLTKGMDWDPRDVWLFLHDNMTEKDWQATQITWDAFEKHWPEMVDMNKRLGNTSPDRVEPRPFQTKFGEMKGGYAPIDYDPIRSRLGARKQDASAIDPSEGLFGKGYFRADTTTNGSLNGRIEGYFDRINLDYHSLEQRLHDTVHDLAYREALIDVHKILMNKDFAKQFKLSNGPEQYKSMQRWLGNLANSQNAEASTSKLVTIMSATRRMIVANGIALRISTVLKHGGSAALKSSGYFSGGGQKYFAARMKAIALNHTAEVEGAIEKFPEIRARLMQQDRDYRQTSSSLFQPESLHARAERFGHSMVAWSDMMTAVPTAWAAYDRAITEGIPKNRGGTGQPMSEADAVAYASQIVREAHGSNIEASRSMILAERNEAIKMFTTLYGFMNNTLGQNMDMVNKMRTNGFSRPEVLSRYLMAMIVPALWAGVLAKPDKKEGWAKWAVGSIAGEYAGMVPMMRDAWSAIEGYSSAGMPAYMSVLGAIAKPAHDVYQAAHGKEVKAPIKDLGNAIGLAIPGAGQIGTSLQYAADVHSGKQQPKNIVDVARGFALGQGNQ